MERTRGTGLGRGRGALPPCEQTRTPATTRRPAARGTACGEEQSGQGPSSAFHVCAIDVSVYVLVPRDTSCGTPLAVRRGAARGVDPRPVTRLLWRGEHSQPRRSDASDRGACVSGNPVREQDSEDVAKSRVRVTVSLQEGVEEKETKLRVKELWDPGLGPGAPGRGACPREPRARRALARPGPRPCGWTGGSCCGRLRTRREAAITGPDGEDEGYGCHQWSL